MMDRTREVRCLSDLRLDRMIAGELTGDAESEARAHLAGCTACSARRVEIEAERDRFGVPPPARMVEATARPAAAPAGTDKSAHRPTRRRRFGGLLLAGPAAAAAAVLVWWAAPQDSGQPVEPARGGATRVKGTHRLGFYVARGGAVARGADGEEMRPGDEVRFTLTAPAPGFAVIASVDGDGAVSIYHPDGPRAAPVATGEDQELPGSLVLDGALGRETIYAFLCADPVLVTDVRTAVASGRPSFTGCRVDVVRWTVRPP